LVWASGRDDVPILVAISAAAPSVKTPRRQFLAPPRNPVAVFG